MPSMKVLCIMKNSSTTGRTISSEPQTTLTYPDINQGYSGNAITYSINEQKKTSLRFWFQQVDNTGVLHNLKSLLSGRVYDSYNPDDFALKGAMRANDYIMRNIPGAVDSVQPPRDRNKPPESSDGQ